MLPFNLPTMKISLIRLLSLAFLIVAGLQLPAQNTSKDDPWKVENFSGLEFRSIGPAFMSGRIADIAIHPNHENTWYVAVGSGGVWKTVNAGNTWKPIFDNESCYSTGCITIDPNNPSIIWLGTGENVGGRHLSFGDGLFKSLDGGDSWVNVGLQSSEHISKIIVHPSNSNIVWVAAQGPLWSKGGERGIYKTTDGGQNWKKTLGNKEWTGATDLVIDPRDPEVLYAATWDRHRTVAAYMGGGPGSGLHSSTDGGETWKKLSGGLPTSNLGKIGLAISPQQPDVLYAAIELDRRKGGVYKSSDKGSTWSKMSSAVSGGTGPHYYQELYACPHNFDRIYLMDVRMQVSDDGGRNFRRVSEISKHSDNHSLAFKKDDPDYLLAGTDGGIYESYDLAKNWKFFSNLPLTQFYKIAVDDAEPFYNVYGGTQDNSTEGGPSRTDNIQGIQNGDWKVVLNWDGHQPACEPGNPDIMYGQRQQGTLSRIDMKRGEVMDIKPQAGPGEPFERFNWDAPIVISTNEPKRIYFASQRLWVSENRGDKWTALSGDLTRNENRLALPIMGGTQSFDNPWDVFAMSTYNTIANIAISPLDENNIYVGTDDGLLQMTKDGGETWNKKEVSSISGVPGRAYVNDIRADLHDKNTVYLAMDNHKEGDYKPYLFKSTNGGDTWTDITKGIPKRNLIWRIVQDHVDPNLLFIGTEFGIYFTVDGGGQWTKLKGGLPTISFRDLKIHKRENDLICGSFGRSIYIYDDISVFRQISDKQMKSDVTLFETRDALWYIPRSSIGFGGAQGNQGTGYYVAPNPPFGATLTYHLKEGFVSAKSARKKKEEEAREKKRPIEFTDWATLDEELIEEKEKLTMVIQSANGTVIRRIPCKQTKGFHKVTWDLRYPSTNMVELSPRPRPEFQPEPQGILAPPGQYQAYLSKVVDDKDVAISETITFEVKPLYEPAEGTDIKVASDFWDSYDKLTRETAAFQSQFGTTTQKVNALKTAVSRSLLPSDKYSETLTRLTQNMNSLENEVFGSKAKREIGEKTIPNMGDRMFALYIGLANSTYGPTQTHLDMIDWVEKDLSKFQSTLDSVNKDVIEIAKSIYNSGGPYIEGIDLK